MDGRSGLARDAFYQTLRRTLPGRGELPFSALPWSPRIHLALFVHRVADLQPGLYLFVRDPAAEPALRAALRAEFAWSRPPECPADLPLWFLHAADVRGIAAHVSCDQQIAADGCFSLGMIARFASSLAEDGAWMYPRLFWESGVLGQVLYLEAEALGLGATGIGCFYDDAVHGVLGLRGRDWQSLYHFTVGGPVHDPRIADEPAYATLRA
jgi:nitroreductase